MSTRTLRFGSGPAAGRTLEIDRELVVGREGVDLTIDDPELSRRHAVLRPVEGGVEVEDLGSLNGTYVDGLRISGPELLGASAKLKLGTSEATLELALPEVTRAAEAMPAPEVTRMAEAVPDPELTAKHEPAAPDLTAQRPTAEPDVTAERPIGDPEVTAERPVAEPDVTAQRPIAEPDVTAQRPIAEPDVTAQRPIADPDVTAQRPIPSPDVTAVRPVAAPDVTVQRPVEAAGPPPGQAPPARRRPRDEGPDGPGGGRRILPIAVGLAVVVVLIVVAIALAAGGGDSSEKRKVAMSFDFAAVTEADKRRSEMRPGKEPIRWKLAGQARGEPFGSGTVDLFVTLQPIPKPPKNAPASAAPAPGEPRAATVTPRFEMSFDGGTVTAVERLQSRRIGGGLQFEGRGRILDGTGDFEGAQGTFTVTGSRPKFRESFERIRWKGTVEY